MRKSKIQKSVGWSEWGVPARVGIEQRLSVVVRRQATWHVPLCKVATWLLARLVLILNDCRSLTAGFLCGSWWLSPQSCTPVSCTPAHFSHSRRFTQSRPGWFLERSKHLWLGCCPHHFHRKWIPAEPNNWRRLSGLNSSIWHCLAHWSSLQTE